MYICFHLPATSCINCAYPSVKLRERGISPDVVISSLPSHSTTKEEDFAHMSGCSSAPLAQSGIESHTRKQGTVSESKLPPHGNSLLRSSSNAPEASLLHTTTAIKKREAQDLQKINDQMN